MTPPRHVGLDLLFLEPQSGGSGTYARELVRAIKRVAPETRLTAWVARDAPATDWPVDEWVRVPVRATGSPARVAAQLAWVGLDARRRGVDVVHGLAYASPALAPGVATVATVLDLTWYHQPEAASALARRMFSLLTGVARRTADRVIAISAWVRDDLVATLGFDPAKVDVVHLGVGEPGPAAPARVPGVPDRYVLFVGQLTPHKNLEVVIEALPQLDAGLVVAGGRSDYGDALSAKAPAGRFTALGYVDAPTLERLFADAAAVVLPSLHEGFGLPVLEAMARGVPVVCSNASALPEIAGGAARLFDPASPAALAEAVNEVLADPEPWVRAGRARAAELTWDATARATLAVYERALGG